MNKYNVIILIEHIARELDSAILLKICLEKRGYSVLIQSIFYDYYRVCIECECDVLVVPYCYDDKDFKLLSHIRTKAILNMHHEQIDTIKTNKLLPKGKAKSTFHLSWGKAFTCGLEKNGVSNNRIYQTGSIRSDFLSPSFKGLVASKKDLGIKYNLDAEKGWILVAGNFSKIYFIDKDKPNPRYSISSEAVKTYYVIVDWFRKLLPTAFKGFEVIYRPHPTESYSDCLDRLEKEYSNFHFIRGENISDWTINSDLIFAYRSTSAVDGLLAKKPTFLLRPFKLEDRFELPILNEMVKASDENAVKQMVEGKVDYFNDSLRKELDYYYDNNGGKSYQKIVNAIVDISKKTDCTSSFSKFSFYQRIKYSFRGAVKNHLSLFNRFGLLKKYENFKYDRCTQQMVKNRQVLIANILEKKDYEK